MLKRKYVVSGLVILLIYISGMVVLYFTETRRGKEVRDYQKMLDSGAPEGPEKESVELAYGFSQKAGEIAEEDSNKAITLLREALHVFEENAPRDIILSRMLEILLDEGEMREAIDLAAEEIAYTPEKKYAPEEIEKKIQERLKKHGSQDNHFNRVHVAIRKGFYYEAKQMIKQAREERFTENEKYKDMILVARALRNQRKNESAIILYKKIASNPDAPFQNIASSRVESYLAFRGKPEELMGYDPDTTDLAFAIATKAGKIAYDGDIERALRLLEETMPMFEGEARHLIFTKKLSLLGKSGELRIVISLITEEARRKPPEEREEALADIEAVKELMEKIEREEILTDVETGADLMKILEDKDILTDVESTRELIERLQELEE